MADRIGAHADLMTRRTFVKAAGTAAGAAAVASMAPFNMRALAVDYDSAKADAAVTADEQVFPGVCRGNCGCGCFLNVHVRDGHVVRTSARDMPDTRYNRICMKGLSHPHRIYSEERLKYPLRRVGERGAGEWERITWDEAIAEIGEKWRGYIDEFGPTSVGLMAGSGNYGLANGMSVGGVTTRFLNSTGLATLNPTVDAAAGFATGRVFGYGAHLSGNEPLDMLNAKTILVWGANPAISQIQTMHIILEARDNGTKVIVIDPMYSQTAARANQYVSIKAGTDGALALGMMNYIVNQGWQDVAFMTTRSDLPCLVKEDGTFLRQADLDGTEVDPADASNAATALVMGADGQAGVFGTVENPQLEGEFEVGGFKVKTAYTLLLERIADYPLDRTAELTGIDEETIKGLAQDYACNGPSTIYTFYGIDHYYNGHWSMGCLAGLAVLTGNQGKPGAACGMQECLGMYFGNSGVASPEGAPGSCATYNAPLLSKAFDEGEFAGQPFNLKSAMFAFCNTVTNMCDRNETLRWMNQCELLVGCDMVMTDTMRQCDIVLPAAHWFEKEDVFVSYAGHPYLLYQAQAVEPAFESRADLDIFNALAEAIGCETFKITTQEYLEQYFSGPAVEAAGMSFEKFKELGACRQTTQDGRVYVYGEDGPFATGSGLAELYLENPAGSNPHTEGWDLEKEHLPYWEPALQVCDNDRRKTYPIQLLSEHSRFRTHTQWFEVGMLKEIDREPFIKLSPEDAEEYHVAQGDRVRAYNELGSVVLTAQINPGLPKGLATCPKGWEGHEFIEGSFTELFTKESNPFCLNQAFFDCTVAIEKL